MSTDEVITLRRSSSNDDLYTPPRAFEPLKPILRSYPTIWEPCAGEGHLVEILKAAGHHVVASDIRDGIEYDVRTAEPPPDVDAIVTNPPFSICKDILLRLVDLHLPFAVLLPTTTINKHFMRPFEGDIRILPVYGRLRFVGHTTSSPFPVCWFTRFM